MALLDSESPEPDTPPDPPPACHPPAPPSPDLLATLSEIREEVAHRDQIEALSARLARIEELLARLFVEQEN